MTDSRNERGADSGDQSALQVADPEDYNSHRRLQQIHNSRERFPEMRREAREMYNPSSEAHSKLTREAYHEKVANALLDYLVEVEPVVTSLAESDKRRELWFDETVDDTTLTLEDIIQQSGKIEQDGEMVPITVSTSRQAYRKANKLLTHVGLGLNLDTGGLPMIKNFDASREDSEATVENVEMDGEPPL